MSDEQKSAAVSGGRTAQDKEPLTERLASHLAACPSKWGLHSDDETCALCLDLAEAIGALTGLKIDLGAALASSSSVPAEVEIAQVLDKWVPLPTGEAKTLAQRIDDELSDYFGMMDEVSKVYDSLTWGRFSKPNTAATHIISTVQELQQREIDEAVKEAVCALPPAASSVPPASLSSLPKRDWRALMEALRIRALALTGEKWEREATAAMMKEAADMIENIALPPAAGIPVERWFSIQTERGAAAHPLRVPWSVAEKAYAVYAAQYGKRQSLEDLDARGGFGPSEMDTLFPGWRDEASEITRLRALLAKVKP